ncbi:hypothetical protein [Labrys miyagiensis]|uniref:hypothetical protein n=1 Tax=Labrys miyagiensis TaxID=346912 RepID=UPI0024E044CD|nr:hypothetical protein [Labrys miyagiensis]
MRENETAAVGVAGMCCFASAAAAVKFLSAGETLVAWQFGALSVISLFVGWAIFRSSPEL